jgi:hypothetical protein
LRLPHCKSPLSCAFVLSCSSFSAPPFLLQMKFLGNMWRRGYRYDKSELSFKVHTYTPIYRLNVLRSVFTVQRLCPIHHNLARFIGHKLCRSLLLLQRIMLTLFASQLTTAKKYYAWINLSWDPLKDSTAKKLKNSSVQT